MHKWQQVHDGEFSGAIKMVWQKNKTNTLEEIADEIPLTDIGLFDFNDLLIHILPDTTSLSTNIRLRFNGIVNQDYIIRRAIDGATDNIFDTNYLAIENFQTLDTRLVIVDAINITNRAKAIISIFVSTRNVGAGNVPSRGQTVGKMDTDTLSGQFSSLQVYTVASTLRYAIGSNVSLLSTE